MRLSVLQHLERCDSEAATKLIVHIAGTINALQAFGRVVRQSAKEDAPTEEGLLTTPLLSLTYNNINVIVQVYIIAGTDSILVQCSFSTLPLNHRF